jgi:hypothetical protein
VEESSKKYRNLSFKEVSDLIRDIFIAQANAAAKDKNEELAKSLREAPEHPGFAALVERVLAKLIGSDDPRGDRVSEKRFVEAWGSVVPEFTTNMNKTDFDGKHCNVSAAVMLQCSVKDSEDVPRGVARLRNSS